MCTITSPFWKNGRCELHHCSADPYCMQCVDKVNDGLTPVISTKDLSFLETGGTLAQLLPEELAHLGELQPAVALPSGGFM